MSFPDILLLAMRWLHSIAAVAWVGGGLFYLMILRPSLGTSQDDRREELRRLGEQFRQMVNTAIAVLLVTGVILTLSRLTSDYVGMPYVIVLVIKIVMALYMFYLVRFIRLRNYAVEPVPTNKRLQRFTSLFTGATAVLVLGVIVFLLADILRALIEKGIEGEVS